MIGPCFFETWKLCKTHKRVLVFFLVHLIQLIIHVMLM